MQQVRVLNHPTYNDGVLEIYSSTPEYDKARKKVSEKMVLVDSLRYSIEYRRQQDVEFAESISKNLELKVKTPKKKFNLENKVKVNGEMYECFRLDDDDPFSNYLYLEKVRPHD